MSSVIFTKGQVSNTTSTDKASLTFVDKVDAEFKVKSIDLSGSNLDVQLKAEVLTRSSLSE